VDKHHILGIDNKEDDLDFVKSKLMEILHTVFVSTEYSYVKPKSLPTTVVAIKTVNSYKNQISVGVIIIAILLNFIPIGWMIKAILMVVMVVILALLNLRIIRV